MNILQGDCIEVRVPETALYKDVTQTCSAALAFRDDSSSSDSSSSDATLALLERTVQLFSIAS